MPDLCQVLGSTLGRLISGNNTFAQIGAGTVLGTFMGAAGRSLDIHFRDTFSVNGGPAQNFSLEDSVDQAFAGFDVQLAASFRAQRRRPAPRSGVAGATESVAANDNQPALQRLAA